MFNKLRVLTAYGARNDESATYLISCALTLLSEQMELQPEEMRRRFGQHLFKCSDDMQVESR